MMCEIFWINKNIGILNENLSVKVGNLLVNFRHDMQKVICSKIAESSESRQSDIQKSVEI